MARILIVDDDAEVLGTVWRALSRDGHEVILAESAVQAREKLGNDHPDMMILDVMMPMQDGIAFCREVRAQAEHATLPILFLSAKWRTDDIVQGLDAGGDDYLTKPFELKEMSARVRALLRRVPHTDESAETLSVGGLRLNPKTFQVSTNEQSNIQLTSTEYRLLHHLMSSPNQAHSVRALLDAVWQYPSGSGDPDLVRAHIRNLRSKVEPDESHPVYVQTIHGVGYVVKE